MDRVFPGYRPPVKIDLFDSEQVSKKQYFFGKDFDIFGSCKEVGYFNRIQNKKLQAQIFSLDSANVITPGFLEQSPCKLHISLNAQDYSQHRDELIRILITHLEVGAINDFKFVKNELLVAKLNSVKQFLEWSWEFKAMLERREIPNSEFENKYINAFMLAGYVRNRRFPRYKEIEYVINTTNEVIKSIQRYQESDQFTIYIPEDADKHKILNLCQNINVYLLEKNVARGKLSDVESPLGNYINLRQEFILSDFHSINNTSCMNMNLRIDAYLPGKDDADKRKLVLREQEESELYQFLYRGLI